MHSQIIIEMDKIKVIRSQANGNTKSQITLIVEPRNTYSEKYMKRHKALKESWRLRPSYYARYSYA